MSDFLPFKNEAFIDFTIPANRSGLESALQRIRKEIAGGEIRAYPIIEGKECASSNLAKSVDPSHPEIVVGTVGYATESDASRALASLQKGFPAWRDVGFEHRAQVLIRAAALMREQKNEIAALIIREVGKTWREADADVAEAIDFCEYYAREALRMATAQKMGDVPGEDNRYFYEARGVAVVIAPWNFPFAIPCGMVVAALVTGNATLLKPAEQSSCIAHRLAKILLQAGVSPTAFAFLPAEGETVGRLLVNSPLVDMICFTGSKAVGLEILSAATKVHPGQRNVKKVVAEMGGKNAIIVDEDADFDEALKGVIQSTFGFAGQKCSACSRLIVVGSAYDTFVSRLCEAAGDMLCGDAADPSTFLGPVIDDVSQARILKLVDESSKELTVGFKGSQRGTGYFVPPTIFRDVPATSKVWKEEVFGPVLACARADSFEAAVAMAVDSQYALTAGVFSRSPAHLQYAREHLRVGNLYLNRGSTGALVYRQPFGGARMSGVGSKAGGPDYLLQFVEPRTVTENTMRRGFAPQS